MAITRSGGSSRSSMTWSAVFTPMMFQDGEEVRDVPGPTNISCIHGEPLLYRDLSRQNGLGASREPPRAGIGGSG